MLQVSTGTGSGQSGCFTDRSVILRLENTEIEHAQMLSFRDWLVQKNPHLQGLQVWKIYFGKQCKNSWGTCYGNRKEIIIKRRSVMTYLHELAHAIDYLSRSSHHDGRFYKIVDQIVQSWRTWQLNG